MNNELIESIKNNEKVVLVIGLGSIVSKETISFVENELNIPYKKFSTNFENRNEYIPRLEKEFSNLKFIYINQKELETNMFFKDIIKDLYCLPSIVKVFNGNKNIEYPCLKNSKSFYNFLNDFSNMK